MQQSAVSVRSSELEEAESPALRKVPLSPLPWGLDSCREQGRLHFKASPQQVGEFDFHGHKALLSQETSILFSFSRSPHTQVFWEL